MMGDNNDNNNDAQERNRYIVQYIRSLKAIEDAMEPLKDQRRDLRNEYRRQGWLTRDELSTAVKAYRLMKGEVDFEQLTEHYDALATTVRGGTSS
tara:strand:+ start:2510 stop:2794 length:285 start_codon:yes stop_codon:yes gene_type:complete